MGGGMQKQKLTVEQSASDGSGTDTKREAVTIRILCYTNSDTRTPIQKLWYSILWASNSAPVILNRIRHNNLDPTTVRTTQIK